MKRLGDEAGKYAGEKLFKKKESTPKPPGEIIMKELMKEDEARLDKLSPELEHLERE